MNTEPNNDNGFSFETPENQGSGGYGKSGQNVASGDAPMGWYPDPAGSENERYWDGTAWTRNLRPKAEAPITQTPAPTGSDMNPYNPYLQNPESLLDGQNGVNQPSDQNRNYQAGQNETPQFGQNYPYLGSNQGGQYLGGQPQNPQPPLAPPLINPQMPTQNSSSGWSQRGVGSSYRDWVPSTNAGVELAGWWRRAFATVIDYLICLIITSLVGAGVLKNLVDGYQQLIDDLRQKISDNADANTSVLQSLDLNSYDIANNLFWMTIILLTVRLTYSFICLSLCSATLGQLILKMRVVDEKTGVVAKRLPIGKALIRVLTFGLISYIDAHLLIFFPMLINYLLPLFTSKRQTVHDMVAKTQVVVLRNQR